jgi:NADH-quinone oxidoreductase subunit L
MRFVFAAEEGGTAEGATELVTTAGGWFLTHAWLIPMIPAAAFFLILFFGKRLPFKGAELAIAAVGASFVLSVGTALQWVQRVEDAGHGEGALGLIRSVGQAVMPRAEEEAHAVVAPVVESWTWWQSGGIDFGIGSHIDGLAVALILVVTIVSLLVHIFSVEYMKGDIRFTHYFAFICLFTAGMLNLVIAENTIQLLLGWEIMGLCSFALIGHWWEEKPNSNAALKAFWTTRTGDIGLLVGISILFFGPGSFSILATNLWALSPEASQTVLMWAAIALFIAIIGKSGQFPLHTWLPDAMAGPTPVSALIHAATMVVAGVYLGARLYPVFWEGFNIGENAVNPMALIGGITILIAAVLAFVQVDIKKVLAYSTVSQLGYMVMGLGVGAWTASVFHIFTHAFFKALLFLGAGSISHSGSHHSFDMKKDMGGLRKYMPITFWTFIIGTLALLGFFPLAGFWSKDEIIANAGHNGYTAFMVVGLVGAFLTAAYMTRCIWLTFFGEYRGGHHEPDVGELGYEPVGEDIDAEVAQLAARGGHGTAVAVASGGHPQGMVDGAHEAAGDVGAHGGGAHDDHGAEPHESPLLLTVPLMILAVLSITVGWLNMPWEVLKFEKFLEWVQPTAAFPELEHAPFSVGLAVLSVGLVVLAVAAVAWLYQSNLAMFRGLTKRSKLVGAGYTFLERKYYLDDLYEKVIVHGISGPIARVANWINQKVIDAVVNGVGVGGKLLGRWTYKNIDQTIVDGAVNGAGFLAEESGSGLRTVQTGKVQQYGVLLFAAAGIAALILVIVV